MNFVEVLIRVTLVLIYLCLIAFFFRTLFYKTEEQFRSQVRKLSFAILMFVGILATLLYYIHMGFSM